MECAKFSRFLWLEKKEVCTGKVPSSALEVPWAFEKMVAKLQEAMGKVQDAADHLVQMVTELHLLVNTEWVLEISG